MNLREILENSMQKGVYCPSQDRERYYHFTVFGSQNCTAEEFTKSGQKIAEVSIRTEEIQNYKFVPESNAPEQLKGLYKQSQPLCTISTEMNEWNKRALGVARDYDPRPVQTTPVQVTIPLYESQELITMDPSMAAIKQIPDGPDSDIPFPVQTTSTNQTPTLKFPDIWDV